MDLYEKVADIQDYKGKRTYFDPDSSPLAIEYYKLIYKNHFKLYNELDFTNLHLSYQKEKETDITYRRLHVQLNESSKYMKKVTMENDIIQLVPTFEISGDCDFNFNDNKYKLFSLLFYDDFDSIHYKKLKDFNQNKHHSLINMSFMITTGGMNNFKGQFYFYDRFDKYIYHLDKFYNEGDEEILCNGKGNKEWLKLYLNQFKDVIDYCENIYFINDDNGLITDLIKSGSKNITFYENSTDKNSINFEKTKNKNKEFIIEYINLAERYWEEKAKNIKKHLKNL